MRQHSSVRVYAGRQRFMVTRQITHAAQRAQLRAVGAGRAMRNGNAVGRQRHARCRFCYRIIIHSHQRRRGAAECASAAQQSLSPLSYLRPYR